MRMWLGEEGVGSSERKDELAGDYVPHEGIGPDPEPRHIADEWGMNYDYPDGEEYLDTLNLHSQISSMRCMGVSGPDMMLINNRGG